MPLDAELGKTMLQLVTSRYDDRHWRKKIEKTLGLPQSGVGDPAQQQIFMYLKIGLKGYKSRRADPDSWIIGGYATKEVIDRAKFQPQLVGPNVTKDDVACLGSDPGKEIDETWWDEMLVQWFDVPEEEKPAEEEGGEAADSDPSPTDQSKSIGSPPAAASALASALLARPHAQSRLAQKLAPFRPMVERSVEQSVPPAESGPRDFTTARLSMALMHASAAAGVVGERGRQTWKNLLRQMQC